MVLLSAIFYGLVKPQSGLMLSCLNAAGDVEELIVGEVFYQVSIRAPIVLMK
jgi:hypothetical protein